VAIQAALADDCLAAVAHGLSSLIRPHYSNCSSSTTIHAGVQSGHRYALIPSAFVIHNGKLYHVNCKLSGLVSIIFPLFILYTGVGFVVTSHIVKA